MLPDKDSLTIYYCFLAFGIVVSLCLSKFAGTSFLLSTCLIIPITLCFAFLSLKLLDWSAQNHVRRYGTPLEETNISGIGELRRYAEKWELQLGKQLDHNETTFTIDVVGNAPTKSQLSLAKAFPEQYALKQASIQQAIRDFFLGVEYLEGYATVDLANMTVHLNAPNEEIDLELTYETVSEHDDMAYTVQLREWEVCDVYGHD